MAGPNKGELPFFCVNEEELEEKFQTMLSSLRNILGNIRALEQDSLNHHQAPFENSIFMACLDNAAKVIGMAWKFYEGYRQYHLASESGSKEITPDMREFSETSAHIQKFIQKYDVGKQDVVGSMPDAAPLPPQICFLSEEHKKELTLLRAETEGLFGLASLPDDSPLRNNPERCAISNLLRALVKIQKQINIITFEMRKQSKEG